MLHRLNFTCCVTLCLHFPSYLFLFYISISFEILKMLQAKSCFPKTKKFEKVLRENSKNVASEKLFPKNKKVSKVLRKDSKNVAGVDKYCYEDIALFGFVLFCLGFLNQKNIAVFFKK